MSCWRWITAAIVIDSAIPDRCTGTDSIRYAWTGLHMPSCDPQDGYYNEVKCRHSRKIRKRPEIFGIVIIQAIRDLDTLIVEIRHKSDPDIRLFFSAEELLVMCDMIDEME